MATNTCLLKDVRVCMKDINLVFIVLEVGPVSMTKSGHQVRTVRVADKTGCMDLSVWDDIGSYISPSDILRLTKGYCGLHRGCPTLYVGKTGELVKIGEFTLIFSETPNFSERDPEWEDPKRVVPDWVRSHSPMRQPSPTQGACATAFSGAGHSGNAGSAPTSPRFHRGTTPKQPDTGVDNVKPRPGRRL